VNERGHLKGRSRRLKKKKRVVKNASGNREGGEVGDGERLPYYATREKKTVTRQGGKEIQADHSWGEGGRKMGKTAKAKKAQQREYGLLVP